MANGSHNFQFSEIIAVSPGGSTLSFGTQTFRPAKPEVIGTGSKSFASGSLRIPVSGATPVSTPGLPDS